MRLPLLRTSVSLVLACWVGFGGSAAAQAPCQTLVSPLPAISSEAYGRSSDEGVPAYAGNADVDGDGKPEQVTLSVSSGSGYGSTTVTVVRASGQRVEVSSGGSFRSFVDVAEVPDVLIKDVPLRRGVESILFSSRCNAPDPSLARLLVEERGPSDLVWLPGEPTMPTSYTVFVDSPSAIADYMKHWAMDDEMPNASGKPAPKALWVTYGGGSHARVARGQSDNTFRTFTKRGDNELWGTAHGVVLVDRKTKRYAWLWIFPGGQKLRAPSIKDAAFVGGKVKVLAARDFVPHGADDKDPHDVTIDLATGRASVSAK